MKNIVQTKRLLKNFKVREVVSKQSEVPLYAITYHRKCNIQWIKI